MTIDARTVPADATSHAALAASGLDYRLVDSDDSRALDAFIEADNRGFLTAEPSEAECAAARATFAERRLIGVFGGGERPVATVASWATPMTIPGGAIDMWAISAVTVAATHRRRGIARALLEGELRAAAQAGLPMAGLTVSEATIYGRFGFASAIPVAALIVDAHRAGWVAGTQPGTLEYVERESLATLMGQLHERVRTQRNGNIPGWPGRWEHAAGLVPSDKVDRTVRGVSYRDDSGEVQGVLCYTLTADDHAFDRHTMAIRHFMAATDDAQRALWNFAVHHDLVSTITVDQRPVDDPLPWLVSNARAVEVRVHDHGWLRILDVPRALMERRYAAPLDVVVDVTDDLGFAAGTYRMTVDAAGHATVTAQASGEADVRLDVGALSAAYLGGVSATQLRAAGRIQASDETAASVTAAFRTTAAPALTIWY